MVSWQTRVLEVYLRAHRMWDRSGQLDVARERADVESMARLFKPLAPIRCTPVDAGGVPAEWIQPAGPPPERVVLYVHGGSFNSGSIASHRTLAGNVAIAARARALLIDYRLAPEHPFPAALDDVWAAYKWLLASGVQPRRLVVAGDSAGGSLTLSLLVRLRDESGALPAAAVCLSPSSDVTFSGASVAYNATKDLMLDVRRERASVQLYLRGADPLAPLVSPYFADLRGLPPLLIQVGSHELLVSDCERFTDKARAAGVDVTLEVWPGMQHEWQFAAKFLPEGRRAIARVGAFADRVLSGPSRASADAGSAPPSSPAAGGAKRGEA